MAPLFKRMEIATKLAPTGSAALLDYLLSSANTGDYATIFGGITNNLHARDCNDLINDQYELD
jgi:hypothetical protein